MSVQPKLYTVDEFEKFIAQPEHSERLFELINGEIVEKVPTEEHAAIAARFTIRVGSFVELRQLGRITVEPRHQMPHDDHNARLPDVAFTSTARALPLVKIGAVPQMPDLVIEILSPTDSLKKLREKAHYYLANGSRMVWLVLPEQCIIEVYTLDDEYILTEADTLDGGDVLPGFTLPVRDVLTFNS
jgi:Uma2 family endonuclease